MKVTELVEGEHGICRRCGSPLTGATLTVQGTPYEGHPCGECGNWTPKPLGNWTPVNPSWPPREHEVETVRDRLEKSLQREGPFPA